MVAISAEVKKVAKTNGASSIVEEAQRVPSKTAKQHEVAAPEKPYAYKRLLKQVLVDSVRYNQNISAVRFTNRDYFAKHEEENNLQRKPIS